MRAQNVSFSGCTRAVGQPHLWHSCAGGRVATHRSWYGFWDDRFIKMWSLSTAPLLLLPLQTFGLSEWMKSFTAFSALYWSFLSVWCRPTGCCVELRSVCDTHLQGVMLNISQCVIYTYRCCAEHCSVCVIPIGCCVEHCSVCDIHL